MPRLPRVTSPGFPQHLIQRGNNREPCFFAESDYLTYLRWLERAAGTYGVSIHAYVLMPNHVHLLATPGMEGGISRMMQYLGRQYVQHINRTYRRSGTLWERRFLASLVDSECCLLSIYRYIESNPVRAGMVAAPEQYRWSSARAHLVPNGATLVADHDVYLRLGDTPQARAEAYLESSRQPLDDEVLAEIRLAIRHGVPLGSDGFKDQIELQLGRRVRLRKAGRKPKR
jgi:REP-associated tyrosine transposase